MDVLSSFLSSVRLASEIYLSVEMSAPWGVAFPDQPDRAIFYVLSRGSCYIEVEGEDGPLPLVGGDLVMLPGGTPHTMKDQPDTPATPVERVLAEGTYDENGVFRNRGNSARTSLIVGRFRFENHGAIPLLSAMPRLIRMRDEVARSVPGLAETLRLLSTEATSSLPGKDILMDRLADVLFVQILRTFVAHEEKEGRSLESRAGLMQTLMDPELSKALALMHKKPEHPWTVAELAERVGMSRTAFAVRFKAKAGVGPLEHLTQWRVQKACEMLRESHKSLDEVAWRVGYESAAAFSKAFKRETGVAPGEFRRRRRA
ncbi:MAG TPA: AraC family transcriptional regulator [Fimbriimonadaceae bacterium]|nr:AraC family transcriptional regulator [Fimbriimonadaceae bacterium]